MEKIRLDLDELAVESFATDLEHEGRGTVKALDDPSGGTTCWHGVGCWYPSYDCTGGSCTCDVHGSAYPCCEQME